MAFVADNAKAYGSAAGSTVVPAPAGIQAGDQLVLAFGYGEAVGDLISVDDPSDWDGFAPLLAGPVGAVGGGPFTLKLRAALLTAVGDETTFTITHGGGATQNTVAWIGAYRGVDPDTPLGGLTPTDNDGTGATTTALGITTTDDDTTLVMVAVDFGDTTNDLTPPTGMTERHDTVVIYAADVEQAAAGASGDKSFTNNGSPWLAILVPLVPEAEGDVTAPVLSNATASETGQTTASLAVDTDEGNGTLFWVVTTSATPPSGAQVAAGQDHTGAAAVDSGSQAVVGTGTQTIAGGASGLTAATQYWAHFVQDDAATNRSNVDSSDSFTTDAEAVPAEPIPASEGAGGGGPARRGRRYPYPNVIDDGWDWDGPDARTEPQEDANDRPDRDLPAVAPVRPDNLDDAASRKQASERVADRAGQSGFMAGLDSRRRGLGAVADEPRALGGVRTQPPEVEPAGARVAALEAEVEALRAQVDELKAKRRDDEEERQLLGLLMEDKED